jgi:hypothetical protein
MKFRILITFLLLFSPLVHAEERAPAGPAPEPSPIEAGHTCGAESCPNGTPGTINTGNPAANKKVVQRAIGTPTPAPESDKTEVTH